MAGAPPGQRQEMMSDEFARRYKLQERIAIGGTAEVFHALLFADDGSQRPVVIKRVLPQFARDERFRRLFLEEACVAVTVTHPNIVRVLDHGELEQTCYIALERVDGMDLGKLLVRARAADRLPSGSMAAFVVAQVGEALQFIHDQTSSEGTPLKIIHRDVSPQNILVSYCGDVKLTDFGIAKSSIRQETTVDGTLRGKLDYMAPEQAALGEVDHRADLFALGCVLYEMVQGVPPFRGANELETLERIREHRIAVSPDELDTPESLKRVLRRALEPERERRYQRAAAMVADLRAFMEDPAGGDHASTEVLGLWVEELAREQSEAKSDAVEQAVRQLLGQNIEDAPPANAAGGTTVFASSGRGKAEAPPATSDIKVVGSHRPLNIALAVVAALGICGWLLWAARYFGPGPDSDRGGKVAAALDSGFVARAPDSAGSTPSPPDSRATPQPKMLRVNSTSAGATVAVDGKTRGQTPATLSLPAEPFLLELHRSGYRNWSRRLDPREVGQRIRATLAQLPRRRSGYLTINSLPWSRVTVDGSFVGNTPLIRLQLPSGKHRVVLQAPGGKVRKTFNVTVVPNKSHAYTFDFTR
jgi:hypothetical protein